MKKIALSLLVILMIVTLISCKKDDTDNNGSAIKDYVEDDNKQNDITPTPTPTNTPEVEITEVPEEISREGQMRSFLTGLWVPEEVGKKRPYAIQFSNFKTVSNQSGIEQADILYEALVEGGITRLLGIGENFTGDRIGSVRSSRHYYASFADEYDAIYIHYGKTKYAVSKLKELKINNLDGETGTDGNVFYRDKTMRAPHNAFTSLDRILRGIDKRGYRTEYEEGYEPHYSFYKEDTDFEGDTSANKVTVKFSPYTSPYLVYNNEDKLYYRYQFGGVHKDSVTGKQLAFKNIIIQFVKQWDIDRNDYQTMEQKDATGSGYYISNGKKINITWKKNEKNRFMRYYDETGQELTMNPGKTFIAIFPNDRTKDVVLE
ncbi:DUF3048 domain-containing protein [Mobilitalea sibirica]|uniref:DUF3048 domain-containing protein n=1 Tax=Mobilitalea sibirica TaxID=1462919 RepID=A0A8J7H382_9FIRM|nr:DUF3048 domain-containing protein [Mobilitalea sibirica]MBH1941458.1 DUF3048 domain-containing protein [Mobilitalea sibirica]